MLYQSVVLKWNLMTCSSQIWFYWQYCIVECNRRNSEKIGVYSWTQDLINILFFLCSYHCINQKVLHKAPRNAYLYPYSVQLTHSKTDIWPWSCQSFFPWNTSSQGWSAFISLERNLWNRPLLAMFAGMHIKQVPENKAKCSEGCKKRSFEMIFLTKLCLRLLQPPSFSVCEDGPWHFSDNIL